MSENLRTLRQAYFVLWRPAHIDPAPALVIGSADGETISDMREIPLVRLHDRPDVWGVRVDACNLRDGAVYLYWFKVEDSDPYQSFGTARLCTDPFATAVDRRFPAPEGNDVRGGQPASVILYRDGSLVPCDANGVELRDIDYGDLTALPTNNHLVIYELPTRWTRRRTLDHVSVGTGTFRDVRELFSATSVLAKELPVLGGAAYLDALGINALELLPPTDGANQFDWGYGTANFFAPDYDLGHPDPRTAPSAGTDLQALVRDAHEHGVRIFCDMVMAFSRKCPLRHVNFLDFFVQFGTGDPEQGDRDGFGGDLFKFDYWVEGYDPRNGQTDRFVPARAYLQLYLEHWMRTYGADGLRLDSVNNIRNDDFLQEFTQLGHAIWRDRGGIDNGFLVVGEELSVPIGLVKQSRLDGLWNESFKHNIRQVILGRSSEAEPSFEWSVRKLIDCTLLGFDDGAQAVNYLTSHDVGGPGNERFYDWLEHNGVTETEGRIKLAFSCLLTAVGIPMILAGDEFAEQQDLDIAQPERGNTNKQIDPINFERLQDEWRQRIFVHVARLIRLRTHSEALAVNAVHFIHVDIEDDRKIVVWQRGDGDQCVIVVANFSDFQSAGEGSGKVDYVVPEWPETPAGHGWREVTGDYAVESGRVGREPVEPWSARVYTLEPRSG